MSVPCCGVKMKVRLNTNTVFESKVLKIGDIIDVPLNVSMRWINRGIAHEALEAKEQFGTAYPLTEIKPVSKLPEGKLISSADFDKKVKRLKSENQSGRRHK